MVFFPKIQCFSFGIMMLEIISGKKNSGFYQLNRSSNLAGYASDLWKEGRGLQLMDPALSELTTPPDHKKPAFSSIASTKENELSENPGPCSVNDVIISNIKGQ
ncbi:hypothetical protein RGQ29_012724 [Quercus rubra]|uniref:Uncharacterized protein n=1 Tax=Quercus rubra TaxID=3512 RepID=A0AAN7G1Z1_QUERU|nr:hypothetical protein RGQ29_012724 [Quercus rubra]